MLSATEKQTLREKLKLYEGNIPHMYLDSKGLVTVGVGHLLKTVQDAQKLNFLSADNKKATAAMIKEDFDAVMKRPKNQEANDYKPYTKLHLDAKDILLLLELHINKFYLQLKTNYNGFDLFPVEVKLALFDMGFNIGTFGLKTKFPTFNAAISKKDWATAARESHRKAPVSEERNSYVKKLLEKAAQSTTKSAALNHLSNKQG